MSKKSSRKNRSKKKTQKVLRPRKNNLLIQPELNEKAAEGLLEVSPVKPGSKAKTTKDLVGKKSAGKKSKLPKITETKFSKNLEEAINTIEEKITHKKNKVKAKLALLTLPKRNYKEYFKKIGAVIKRYTLKLGAVLLLILVIDSIFITVELISHNRILPRTSFAAIDLSYQKAEPAKQKVITAIQEFEKTPLQFAYQEKTIELSLQDLGIQIDQEKTFTQIPEYYFSQNSFLTLLFSSIKKHQYFPVYKLDSQRIESLLETKFELAAARAANAGFFINKKKTFEIKPEKEGIKIDSEALSRALAAKLNNLDGTVVYLETIPEKPQVTTQDLEKQSETLIQKLNNGMHLNYKIGQWKFEPDNHLDQLDFRKNNDQIEITVKERLITEFLQPKVFDLIEVAPSDVKISYNPEGSIVFEGTAEDGIKVNHEKFIQDLEAALNTSAEEIEIITDISKAKVETDDRLKEIGIKELLGTGHTAYVGSTPNRKHNINVAMKKFNGVIIKPGETFSFNQYLGEVDGKNGYKMELVIKAEGTVPEYGGGVCQVSSTAFKAALFTGLPIVERAPHSYAVSYYAQVDGYGLDATIYPGVRDLKFTNDTPASILIQTFTTPQDHAYFKFYGTGDGRKVWLEKYSKFNYRGSGGTQIISTNTLPAGAKKQVEAAHPGFDASWERVIIKPDGQEVREEIYSRYRATANKILVGGNGE
jgi:vancomycin resistance protein YoaR